MKAFERKAIKLHASIDDAVRAHLKTTDKMILSFMEDPSVREIGRALYLPKSTVQDSIQRLRAAGFTQGRWVL